MTHSDDKGLVLPPKLAPVKAVIVPIFRKDEEKVLVLEVANKVAAELNAASISCEVDAREGYNPGNKFFHWEQRGVPVTIEIGPRDIAAGNLVAKRRDTGVKEILPLEGVAAVIAKMLETMQTGLLAAANDRLKANTVVANSFDEVAEILSGATAEKGGGKFVMAHIKDDPDCDAKVKELKASVRCLPLVDNYDGPGKCIVTGETVSHRSVIAKSY
jgi:prolyl-tRNA synthetase